MIDETVNDGDNEKSGTGIESYESIEEIKYPWEYEDGGIFFLDEKNEKEISDLRVQAMFRRSRNNNLSELII